MPQSSFSCVIDDPQLGDVFSADIRVEKKPVIRTTAAKERIELANIYITPISGQFFTYLSNTNWKKTPVQFPTVETREKIGSHNHFVLYDFTGRGLYIVRDAQRREIHRRECSIWDLGQSFAIQVMSTLKELA